MIAENVFSFLNHSARLEDISWDGEEASKLWRYNQHYFDDLNAIDSERRTNWHTTLIGSWLAHNPTGRGTGWEPYPTSLRIVNWIKWFLSGFAASDAMLKSLYVQAAWLFERIEWHILGNHLFANAKALVFAGCFFESEKSQQWFKKGLEIVRQELTEQVLPDGGNFERSPMYHSIFLEDLLDLINLSKVFPEKFESSEIDGWKFTARNMLVWLKEMCHPDGEISFFNDSAVGIAPAPNEIIAYAKRLEVITDAEEFSKNSSKIIHFPDSGYIRLSTSDATLIFDVAPVGPDYLPGHAHADTLSFELSIGMARVFVNGGTSQYGVGLERFLERSTASHNTVEVNGQNSSEVWSGFRVARRAYPMGLKKVHDNDVIRVECSHDGYLRLKGKPVHQRQLLFGQKSLLVTDRVSGFFRSAVSRFHVHPSASITRTNERIWLISTADSEKTIQFAVQKGRVEIVEGLYAPEFGLRIKNQCFCVFFDSKSEVVVQISWENNE